jgi:hypothetical protein
VDWWQELIILIGIGLISVVIGLLFGIPLSNIILRRRKQVSTGNSRIRSTFEPKYSTTDQLDELLEKYGMFELKTSEQGKKEAGERGGDEAEATAGQVEPVAIDRILLELSNRCLGCESRYSQYTPAGS